MQRPVALCFGTIPEFIKENADCIFVAADASVDEAYIALENRGNDGRICVFADCDGATAAWRFAAEFHDRIAGVAVLSDGGCPEDVCRVKFAPALVPEKTARRGQCVCDCAACGCDCMDECAEH